MTRATWPLLVLLAALAVPVPAVPQPSPMAPSQVPPLVPPLAPSPAAPQGNPACAAPAELTEAGAALPATSLALRARQLRVVVVGSASVLGAGTSGPAAGWPGRLQLWLAARHPGLTLEVTVRGGRGLTAADTAAMIADELARAPAHLVLWQTATVEAVRGLEIDAMVETLNAGLERIHAAGADAVLVEPQFSRFLRANANIEPYRDALRLVAAAQGVALFRRYDLMHFWAETERIDLERAPRAARIATADRLAECLAEAIGGLLAQGVAEARGKLPPRP